MRTSLLRYLKTLLLRKHTTPVHIAAGVLLALLIAGELRPLGLALFIGFAWFEYWECQRTGDSGHLDYWEVLLGMFLAAAVMVLR